MTEHTSDQRIASTVTAQIPRATYRIQLNPQFPFQAVAAVTDYLARLGISHVYLSPLLTPRRASSHGYDTVDHSSISPELGGEAGFQAMIEALHRHGLQTIVDIVPNHMGIGDERNLWWNDVLENGQASIYAAYFDVDWQADQYLHAGKLLLPILGDQYGAVLERGELQLSYADGVFVLNYWDHRFPISPRTYDTLLQDALERLPAAADSADPDTVELLSILTAIGYLPPREAIDPERIAERHREKEVVKRRLAALTDRSEPVQAAILATLATFNGDPASPQSFDRLDGLLERQAYRLAFWRVATEEINYRRFFDINDLAAVRVEEPEVFRATHDLILRLAAAGAVNGLRIDHIDGLWQPAVYLERLQERYLQWCCAGSTAAGAADDPSVQAVIATARAGRRPWPLYVVVEKILAHHEQLPAGWATAGTTGYDALNDIIGVLVDQRSASALTRSYQRYIGTLLDYPRLVTAKKKEILLISLASELNMLSRLLDRLSEKTRRFRDFTLNSLTFALREVIAAMPVYRTYIDASAHVTDGDAAVIEQAVTTAQRANPRTAHQVFDFLRDTLLLRNLAAFAPDARAEVLRFVLKFQQLTGPVMAKGVEDTAFYVYHRLSALNEVGGHPERFGIALTEFHQQVQQRRAQMPYSMITTSTHDTKRSEDVRARLAVLSEVPQEWQRMLQRWSRLNARHRQTVDGVSTPDRNDEVLLYQTLIGIWHDRALHDDTVERVVRYMEKATREAKVRTSWINPNQRYDQAIEAFCRTILDPRRSTPFLQELQTFSARIAVFGRWNSLSQTTLKLTLPGVPDIYQGNELWDLSLVDPDNRRPVDYGQRLQLLDELEQLQRDLDEPAFAADLLRNAADGRIKLAVTARLLRLRAALPALFLDGDYQPLQVSGSAAEHVIAFARRHEDHLLLVVVPRLTVRLCGSEQAPIGAVWQDTAVTLPSDAADYPLRPLFGRPVTPGAAGLPLRDLLQDWPLAVLVSGPLDQSINA